MLQSSATCQTDKRKIRLIDPTILSAGRPADTAGLLSIKLIGVAKRNYDFVGSAEWLYERALNSLRHFALFTFSGRWDISDDAWVPLLPEN